MFKNVRAVFRVALRTCSEELMKLCTLYFRPQDLLSATQKDLYAGRSLWKIKVCLGDCMRDKTPSIHRTQPHDLMTCVQSEHDIKIIRRAGSSAILYIILRLELFMQQYIANILDNY